MDGPPSILPDDVIMEILLKLPMKDLVRFRRVCKSWQYLITSPDSYMIFHHRNSSLKQNTSGPDNQFLLLENYSTDAKPELQIRELLGNLREKLAEDNGLIRTHRLIFQDGEICLVGCCDGLLCFIKAGYRTISDVYLCNPVLGQARALPKSEFQSMIVNTVFVFYYDDLCNDFKVVKIIQRYHEWKVEVYSLTSNSWKTFCPIVTPFCFMLPPSSRSKVLVHNGRIYLLVDGTYPCMMILEVNEEKVRVIPLPSPGDVCLYILFLSKESVAVSYFLFGCNRNFRDYWVLEEDANDNDENRLENVWEKFWTKKSISLKNCPYVNLLPYMTTGVTMGADEIVFPSSYEASKFLIRFHDRRSFSDRVVADYVPSLISVMIPPLPSSNVDVKVDEEVGDDGNEKIKGVGKKKSW